MRRIAILPLLIATAACSGAADIPGPDLANVVRPSCSQPAPLHGTPDSRVADSYIVVFRDGTASASVAARLGARYGFQPRRVYEHALQGFSAVLSAEAVAGIRCEGEVRYVEHDATVTVGG